MPESERSVLRPEGFAVILGLSLFTLALHLAVNAFGGYGIFRDEYYYIACSKRLAAGYVDQPPLSMFLLALSRTLFGVSQFALRIFPALAHAGTVVLAGVLARRLGGRRTAIMLACLAAALAPIFLGMASIFQMNAFAFPLWGLSFYLVIRIIEDSRPKFWLLLGVLMGLGLLNKVDFLWFGLGLALALILTSQRRHLATPWPYAAAGIALALFSPFILWNAAHGFPHLEFIRNATAGKYSGLSRLAFVAGQAVLMNPVSLALWIPGLYFLFFGREGKRWRPLGIIFAAAFLVLFANAHSKAEYLAPAYIVLFAAGGVALENWAARPRRRWAVPTWTTVFLISTIIILPVTQPVLPVQSFVRYSAALGIKPSTPEGKQLSELPQFYADMFGWEELARDVSAVYLSLPESERASTVVAAGNYGEAASIEYWAAKYPEPRVISTHNNYWFWGYPRDIRTAIVLGGKAEDHEKKCIDVTLAATHTCRYCMPYENNLPIYVCRGLRLPMAEIWSKAKDFD